MAGVPEYTSTVAAPGAPRETIAPLQAPYTGGAEVGQEALSKLGGAITDAANKVKQAQNEAQAIEASTDHLTQLDGLKTKYLQDPDYANAADKFQADAREAERENSGRISDPLARARAVLEWRRKSITDFNDIRTHALTRQKDAVTADLDTQGITNINDAATASSPVARQAAIDRNAAAIDGAAGKLWISKVDAENRKVHFASELAEIDVRRGLQSDPAAVASALEDGKQYPGLDPKRREVLIGEAHNAADRLGVLRQGAIAVVAPERAALNIGRVAAPDLADPVFDRGILKLENAKGDNSEVSSKGAVGISQIMPATARDMAPSTFAGMDDAAITEKLKSDPALNVQLGRGYFRQMVGRYADTPVQIAAAAAAYNAGPGRADKWIDAARAQFGPSFTAAQFQSVIDIKETRDYVGNLYKNAAADMGGAGLSPFAQYHAAAAAKQAQAEQLAEQRHAVTAAADAARITDNPELLMGDGMTPDPVKLGQYKLLQVQAAAAGDVAAAKNLREIALREDVLPLVRQIQRMPTGQAEEFVTAAETSLANSPVPTLEQRTKVHFLRDALDRTKQLANTDPVALAERTGMVAITPLDPQAPAADPNFAAALGKRAMAARAAADFYGVSDKPFKPAEAETLKDRFGNAAPNEQADLIATLGKAMGNGASYHAALKQIGADRPVFALAGELAAARPDLAREILHGVPLLKDKEATDKIALVTQVLSDKLGGQIYPSAEQQNQLVEGALALDAARRSAGGTLYVNSDASGVGKAIDDIAGTTITRNGVKVPLPPTMPAADASSLINHFGDRELQLSGGAIDRNGKPMTAADINAHGKWRPLEIGGSRYVIDMPAASGDAPVMNYNGHSLVVDLAMLGKPTPPAAVPPMQKNLRATITNVAPRPGDRRPEPPPPEPERDNFE